MKTISLLTLSAVSTFAIQFEDPVYLMADGEPIMSEKGESAPCLADIDGDGKKELLVGQLKDGKIRVFRKVDEGFSDGEWLLADGEVATIPGVW